MTNPTGTDMEMAREVRSRGDIKPCPFCGGFCEQHVGLHDFVDVKISCPVCDAEGPIFNNESKTAQQNADDAVAHWNKRIEAAATRLEGLNAWQPIETAPKDGSEFLVTRDNWASDGNVAVAWWAGEWCRNAWEVGFEGKTGRIVPEIWKYWQPLPAPPAALTPLEDPHTAEGISTPGGLK